MRVRFPSPAPGRNTRSGHVPRTRLSARPWAGTGFVPHTRHTRMPSRLTLAAFLLILRCLRGLLPHLADQLSECPCRYRCGPWNWRPCHRLRSHAPRPRAPSRGRGHLHDPEPRRSHTQAPRQATAELSHSTAAWRRGSALAPTSALRRPGRRAPGHTPQPQQVSHAHTASRTVPREAVFFAVRLSRSRPPRLGRSLRSRRFANLDPASTRQDSAAARKTEQTRRQVQDAQP